MATHRDWRAAIVGAVAAIALGVTAAAATARTGLILEAEPAFGERSIAAPGYGSEVHVGFDVGGTECLATFVGQLLHNTKPTDKATVTFSESERCNLGGGPTGVALTDKGTVAITAKPKFVLDLPQLIELCERSGCKTKELPCNYETAKLAGTLMLPGHIEFGLAGTLKLNARTSDSSCARSLHYEGSGWMLVSPYSAYYGRVGSL